MNKYIKAVFCVPLAGIKYAILKIRNGGRFHAAFPAIMSPMTEVTVDGKSELRIAKKLKCIMAQRSAFVKAENWKLAKTLE